MEGSPTETTRTPELERPLVFDTPSYERLLQGLLDEGRSFVDFEDRESGVVLHHDVALSLDRALTMARLETTLRIGSTYFVPLDAPVHDASTVTLARTVRTLSRLGHEVGLLFDAGSHWDDEPSESTLRSRIEAERGVLSRLLEESVDVVSFYQPTERHRALELSDAINASRPPDGDAEYRCLVDREFRGGRPFEEGIPERFRLLVHPGLWHPVERSEAEVLDERRQAAYEQVTSYFDAFDIHESME